jgi:hypothetical protein
MEGHGEVIYAGHACLLVSLNNFPALWKNVEKLHMQIMHGTGITVKEQFDQLDNHLS